MSAPDTLNALPDAPPDGPARPAIFDAVLTPNRSLSRFGFLIMMAAVSAITMGLGIYFFLKGAWPVLGFFGLDIVLLYVAFRLSYRSGRLTETVRITDNEVVVRRITPNGRETEWRFNPYWLRLEVGPTENGSPITLASHGTRLGIAAFLGPEERSELAAALEAALAEANRPNV